MESKWIKRADGSIDLVEQFAREFYEPSPKQRLYLKSIEAIEPISHKQLAATVLVSAHMNFAEKLDYNLQYVNQIPLFDADEYKDQMGRA